MNAAVASCPGCGIALPAHDGPTHAYMLASPACWAAYGEVLAREYADAARMRVHRLTVDAYAVQHPGIAERRSIQSVGVHLISLHAVFERGLDHDAATALIGRAVRDTRFEWLTPPAVDAGLTVLDVLPAATAEAHIAAVERWARATWARWAPHHPRIRAWAAPLLR